LESSTKGGQNGLQLLNLASKIIGDDDDDKKKKKKLPVSSSWPTSTTNSSPPPPPPPAPASASKQQQPQQTTRVTAPEAYFQAWNRRDMDAAVAMFSDNVI
jgi:hypothetical protein